MADNSFGLKELNLIGSGTPKIESPNNINLSAVTVAISTQATEGGNLEIDWQTFFGNSYSENSGMDWIKYSNQSITFVDEPSTTEEITYTINGRVGETGTSLYVADGSSSRAWTLIELAP